MKNLRSILVIVALGISCVTQAKIDDQPPEVKVEALPGVVSEMTTVSVNVNDDSNLKYVVVNLNNENVGFFKTTGKFKQLQINLDKIQRRPLANGKHELEIYAEDSAGNRSSIFKKDFEVKDLNNRLGFSSLHW